MNAVEGVHYGSLSSGPALFCGVVAASADGLLCIERRDRTGGGAGG